MEKGRKKSGRQEDGPLVQAAKEEVLPGYEEYLVLLQERNRLLKEMRQKDKNKIDQERRKQEFSLYVNDPHKDGKSTLKSPGNQPTIPTQPAPKTDRKPKTAGEHPRNQKILDNRALEEIAREELERQKGMSRAKTAPSARERRRNLNVDSSVEIRTTQGGKKIKAPEILSGRYADYFEPDEESDELRSSARENSADESPTQSRYRKPPVKIKKDIMEKLEKYLPDWAISSDECFDEDEAGTDQTIQQEISELEAVLTESGIEGLKQKLHEEGEKWKKIKLNTAITGSSGVGKSSLINAILDLSPEDDENAAKVDVKETTVDLAAYHHPHNQNFVVWDMPGVGTPKFPKENYLEVVKFDRYDFFLIVSANRFTENDEWLAKQIQSRKKRFYFIRTGIDVDILKNKKSKPRNHQPAAVIKVVRDDCVANLKKAGIKKPLVFLVDNYDKTNQMFDFGSLQDQLLNDSDSLKIEAMALSLSGLTKAVLERKRKALEKNIEQKTLEIACLFESPSEQRKMFKEEIAHYQKQFRLEESTLQENKNLLNLSDQNIEKFRNVFYALGTDMKNFRHPIIRKTVIKLAWLLGHVGSKPYSREALEFSFVALYQNLSEMYIMASEIYDFEAQKGLSMSCIKK